MKSKTYHNTTTLSLVTLLCCIYSSHLLSRKITVHDLKGATVGDHSHLTDTPQTSAAKTISSGDPSTGDSSCLDNELPLSKDKKVVKERLIEDKRARAAIHVIGKTAKGAAIGGGAAAVTAGVGNVAIATANACAASSASVGSVATVAAAAPTAIALIPFGPAVFAGMAIGGLYGLYKGCQDIK